MSRVARSFVLVLGVGSVGLTGCQRADDTSGVAVERASFVAPDREITVVGPSSASLTTADLLTERAPIVVVAATDSDPDLVRAAAEALTAPVLSAATTDVVSRFERWGTRQIIAFGTLSEHEGQRWSALAPLVALGSHASVDDLASLTEQFGGHRAELGVTVTAVVSDPADPEVAAAAATLAAAGGSMLIAGDADVRNDPELAGALGRLDAPLLVIGEGPELAAQVRMAVSAPELPGGGTAVFPGRRIVALYGHPEAASLGVLGEQGIEDSIARAEEMAARYAALVPEPVIPAFEIIATVADSSPGADGDYSKETGIEVLRPWVDAAAAAGMYVVLDLQPGRTDFLTQAKLYEPLLLEPHVGLALDPEWRLAPDQIHMQQIGSVGVDEINTVIEWLAALVRDHDLPQKVLTLHQFSVHMITERERLVTDHPELAILIHADGLGTQPIKQATWQTLQVDLPADVWLGWKNFYDEDSPMLTPEETIAQVDPTPWLITYQ